MRALLLIFCLFIIGCDVPVREYKIYRVDAIAPSGKIVETRHFRSLSRPTIEHDWSDTSLYCSGDGISDWDIPKGWHMIVREK